MFTGLGRTGPWRYVAPRMALVPCRVGCGRVAAALGDPAHGGGYPSGGHTLGLAGPVVSEPAFFPGSVGGGVATGDAELAHRGGEIVAHGSWCEVHMLGDGLDRIAGACCTQDVEFATGQWALRFGEGGGGDVGVDVAVSVGDVAQDVGEAIGWNGLGNEAGHACCWCRRSSPGRA